MSFDVSWDVDKYKTEHESEEQWLLRRTFMVKWKNDYPEDRLVCLAQIFANIEFLGCRYPLEVMKEVSRLSYGLADYYRKKKQTKLQRTFVSASDAASDRAKGVKREGGIIRDVPPKKNAKIEFVPQSKNNIETEISEAVTSDVEDEKPEKKNTNLKDNNVASYKEYKEKLDIMPCLDVRLFNDKMYATEYGKFVFLIRPWTNIISNIAASCQSCHIPFTVTHQGDTTLIHVNNILLVSGPKSAIDSLAWNKLVQAVPSIYYKEQWADEGSRVSVGDVRKEQVFGAPVDNAVAMKMMKLMGWKGGGLGADAQGIAEPIKPHLQIVNRAGLGSSSKDLRHLRQAGLKLMKNFIVSDTLDVDLVFSSDFTKEERALLHSTAKNCGLTSKSYGVDSDRFLVVRKKSNPYTLFKAIVAKGGETPKFKVYLPSSLANK